MKISGKGKKYIWFAAPPLRFRGSTFSHPAPPQKIKTSPPPYTQYSFSLSGVRLPCLCCAYLHLLSFLSFYRHLQLSFLPCNNGGYGGKQHQFAPLQSVGKSRTPHLAGQLPRAGWNVSPRQTWVIIATVVLRRKRKIRLSLSPRNISLYEFLVLIRSVY